MGHTVTIAAADGGFDAYLAAPSGPGPAPGVVVLQEIFGVNANIRGIVDDFAAEGYAAIAPDLFWRQRPGLQLDAGAEADRALGMQLLAGLDEQLALADASAAAQVLRNRAGGSGWVGAVGYCMGGKLAYLMAAAGTVQAAVSYYGVGIHAALDRADLVAAPLLLHLADEDALCPPDAQRRIEAAFATVPDVRIDHHPGVGHAFARRHSPAYVWKAAETADAATLAFLHRSLIDA